MLSANDADQLAFAVSQQCALVTFNFSDFVNLHQQYLLEDQEHWGIILSTAEQPNL